MAFTVEFHLNCCWMKFSLKRCDNLPTLSINIRCCLRCCLTMLPLSTLQVNQLFRGFFRGLNMKKLNLHLLWFYHKIQHNFISWTRKMLSYQIQVDMQSRFRFILHGVNLLDNRQCDSSSRYAHNIITGGQAAPYLRSGMCTWTRSESSVLDPRNICPRLWGRVH